MYAICDIIYGVPFSEDLENELDSLVPNSPEMKELFEEWDLHEHSLYEFACEEWGVETYSGHAGPNPGWFGVSIDQTDESAPATRLSTLHLSPTPGQKEKVNALFNSMPKQIADILRARCDVYLVWSTS
jgi:hypothetical protein